MATIMSTLGTTLKTSSFFIRLLPLRAGSSKGVVAMTAGGVE
jgi:hypothetical protein